MGGSDFDRFLQCFGRKPAEGVGPPEDPTCEASGLNRDGFVGGPDCDEFLQFFDRGA